DRSEDVALVDAMRRHIVETGTDVTGPDDRRYDRAFVRSAEWFDGVESYLDGLYPPRTTRRGTRAAFGLGAVVLFAACVLLAPYLRPDSTAVSPEPPAASSDTPAPSPRAQSLPPLLVPVRLRFTDRHLSCTGCYRLEGSFDAPYAWTSGKADFAVKG